MARFLVTGRAGSGKTTVMHELLRRGLHAIDTDEVTGLASWRDDDGKPVTIEDASYVNVLTTHWIWDKDVLQTLLADNDDLFLCGSAVNDTAFFTLFDQCFVLDVSPAVQTKRLQNRTDNSYGQDPRMAQAILTMQHALVVAAEQSGARLIDADQPITNIVDDIVSSL